MLWADVGKVERVVLDDTIEASLEYGGSTVAKSSTTKMIKQIAFAEFPFRDE